jgi:hypothetical protein
MGKKTEITYINEKTFDIQEFNHIVDDELITCDNCGHQWDGWAQCICLGIVESDYDDDLTQLTQEIKITQPKRMTLRSDTKKNKIQTKNCCSKK